MRLDYTCLAALAAAVFTGGAGAQDLVDLSLTANACTTTGDIARVDLYATSNGSSSPLIAVMDTVLSWDPTVLELLGEDSSGSPVNWLVTGFLTDGDGINLTFTDGDAIFTALANPSFPAAAVPPPGLYVTSFEFRVLRPTAGATVAFVPMQGNFGETRVLTNMPPNTPITGDISDTHAVASCNLGVPYCGNTPNSTGDAAVTLGTGSVDIVVNNLTLSTHRLPLHQFGYYLASDSMGFIDLPASGLSQGFFCLGVGPNLGRYNGTILNSGAAGSFELLLDLGTIPINALPGTVALLPGDTWYFQAWYRDAGNSNNFSDAIGVTFR